MLAYSERGKGPPIVLVHGFPLDSGVFENQLSELSAQFRVITPDLPGFGKSGPPTPFSMESVAHQLHAFLEQIGALPCVLGGLSMGGYVSLAFARTYAADLHGLIFIDTRAEGDTPEGKIGRNEMIELAQTGGSNAIAEKMMPKMLDAQTSARQPSVASRLRGIMQACPAQTIQYALAAMRDRPDFTKDLLLIRKPVLVMVGEGDVLTTPAMSRKMHEAIAGSKLVEIPVAGHMSPMENPQAVSVAIADFAGGARWANLPNCLIIPLPKCPLFRVWHRRAKNWYAIAMIRRLPLVFTPQLAGGFTVTSPVLPELITEGDTLEEAFANVRDALPAVLELYVEENRSLPPGIELPSSGQVVWTDALVEVA